MKSGPWIQGGVIIYLVVIGILAIPLEETPAAAKAPVFAMIAAAILLTKYANGIKPSWENTPLFLATLAASVSAWYWIADVGNSTAAWVIVGLALPSMVVSGFLGWLAFKLFGSK